MIVEGEDEDEDDEIENGYDWDEEAADSQTRIAKGIVSLLAGSKCVTGFRVANF